MFEPDLSKENALRFSRFDVDHPLSAASNHAFMLEDQSWQTAEHYYQVSKYTFDGCNRSFRNKIEAAPSAQEAYNLGNAWFKRKRPDFKAVRPALMSRALYSKTQQHQDVKDYLIASGEQLIMESTLYDHYWGSGRDQRGENTMGRIWMDIRKKLMAESGSA